MKTPLILFSLSLAVVVAVFIPGSPLDEFALYGGLLSLAAAFFLLLIAAVRDESSSHIRPVRPSRSARPVLVDGSNVMHWAGGKPDLETVKLVVQDLMRQGFAPTVWFDANAGYLTQGRYLGPRELARPIGLPHDCINLAPRGTPADPLILQRAQKLRARVVTNDQFRDWSETYPYLTTPGVLVPGQIARGLVSLTLN